MTADDPDDAAVRAVLEVQRAAWNRGDLDAFMAGYLRSPDLVMASGDKLLHGFDAVRASYQERYGVDRSGMGRLELDVLRIQRVGPDKVFVLGRWRLMQPATATSGGGVFTLVMEKRPEGWRIIHDHTSSAT